MWIMSLSFFPSPYFFLLHNHDSIKDEEQEHPLSIFNRFPSHKFLQTPEMSTICLYLDQFNNGSQLSVGFLSKFFFMVKICIVWLMSRCECYWSENSSALEGRSFNNNIGNGTQAWKVPLSAGVHQSLYFSLLEWAHSAASQRVIAHLHQYGHWHRSSVHLANYECLNQTRLF